MNDSKDKKANTLNTILSNSKQKNDIEIGINPPLNQIKKLLKNIIS